MKKFKVQSVTAYDDQSLEQILNEAVEKLKSREYEIISIMFIGNNSKMERIYQIVTQHRD